MKKKNSGISIKKVTGNVVISQGQHGGVTAHEINPIEKKTEKKSFFQNKYVQLIGLVSAVLGTLSYFGFQPDTKNNINNQNTVKEMPIKDTIKTLKEKFKRKTEIKPQMKKDNDNTEKENSISVKNITGDVVISQNQTGGITAHSINVNEIQNPEWSLGESEKIGENEYRTIFTAKGKGNMAYYNWNILFTLNTEVIKREDVPGKVSVGPWMPLNVQGGNLAKNNFFIGFAEFKPGQYFSIYLYSAEPIKVLRADVLSE